jgi:adenylate cyclase
LRLLDLAIERDPGMASAYAWKVCVLSQAWVRGYREFTQEEYDMCGELISKGMAIDDNDLECLRIMCEYYMEHRDFDEAERFHEKAFRLNPNDPRIVAQRGELLTWRGKAEEGVTWIEHAMRLDPLNAEERAHLLGRALFGARRYEDALKAFRNTPKPRPVNCAYAAACHALAGLPEQQNASKETLLREKPDFAVGEFVDQIYYEFDADKTHLREGLTKAGLPS